LMNKIRGRVMLLGCPAALCSLAHPRPTAGEAAQRVAPAVPQAQRGVSAPAAALADPAKAQRPDQQRQPKEPG